MWTFIHRLYTFVIYGLIVCFLLYIIYDLSLGKHTSIQTYIYTIVFFSGVCSGIFIQRIFFYLSKRMLEEKQNNIPIDHIPGNEVEDNDDNKLEGIPDQNEKVELPV